MPLLESDYSPILPFKNGHVSTIYSGLFRKVAGLQQTRERLELSDGDFLDLDWSFSVSSTKKVILLLHGLEGNGQRPYITGSAQVFNETNYDACAVNFRGCSGETNRLFRSYHSGATEDLEEIVQHILRLKKYDEIYIKGVSLGGNLALKYIGEPRSLPKEIKAVIGISVPCNLSSSLTELLKAKNFAYSQRFKKHLVAKLRLKEPLFPERLTKKDIARIKNLKDFDDIYTSRAHGFKNAMHYYEKCSCLQFLPNVQIPTLIINAQNDSFLGPECFPIKEAKDNKNIYLEIPKFGGHVGFWDYGNRYHNEKRAIKFIEEGL
ncbi:alpha/beta fold hydrolase [Euzebyella marina]|uniref:Alpha/beta fold hydrolase n=1 Tax=Euzebyella marina TaxID=1761453 RepID=A0A3G2LB72_9FLAO|nr:alpha/beta fold hydrolase [Euzebyella marina]AYN69522.1 alpha/beta fold hydrolase [Euzebyella marina]